MAYRALGITDLVGYGLLAFVAFKAVQIGPYETALLVGRCLHVFIVALQGYV